MTRRRAILEALKARLEAIAKVDGFATDAGANVYLNELPTFGPDDPEVAIVMLVNIDEPKWQGEHVLIGLPIRIAAMAKAALDEPWLAVEDLLGDIKRAVELEDRRLGRLLKGGLERGATVTLERETGSESVGGAITYVAPYAERWGYPEI